MLSTLLRDSGKTVVFTGAGMSTESGLRDFRSADRGMWNGKNPMDLASTDALEHNTAEFIEFYRWRVREMLSHYAHEGHFILGNWERAGVIEGIITQNVDDYHEAGRSINIAHLHGDLSRCRCQVCGAEYSSQLFLDGHTCTCGGMLRPNIVLFGEMLPEQDVSRANKLIEDCELLLVLGTSLNVAPANMYVAQAKEQGAKVVIINKEPTKMDRLADVVYRMPIGEVLRNVAI